MKVVIRNGDDYLMQQHMRKKFDNVVHWQWHCKSKHDGTALLSATAEERIPMDAEH